MCYTFFHKQVLSLFSPFLLSSLFSQFLFFFFNFVFLLMLFLLCLVCPDSLSYYIITQMHTITVKLYFNILAHLFILMTYFLSIVIPNLLSCKEANCASYLGLPFSYLARCLQFQNYFATVLLPAGDCKSLYKGSNCSERE